MDSSKNKLTPEESIRIYGIYTSYTVGDSMQPMLVAGRDKLCIEKCGQLQPNDVALYRRTNGQLVLHRIISITPDGYYTRGDNLIGREKITNAMVIGVLTGYYCGEKYIDCRQDKGYLHYVKGLARRYPLRYARQQMQAMKRRVRRLLKRWKQN